MVAHWQSCCHVIRHPPHRPLCPHYSFVSSSSSSAFSPRRPHTVLMVDFCYLTSGLSAAESTEGRRRAESRQCSTHGGVRQSERTQRKFHRKCVCVSVKKSDNKIFLIAKGRKFTCQSGKKEFLLLIRTTSVKNTIQSALQSDKIGCTIGIQTHTKTN